MTTFLRTAIAVTFTLFTTSLSAGPAFYSDKIVERECVGKWKPDIDMAYYCMDKRREGYDEYVEIMSYSVDGFLASIERCQRKWQHEWDMVAHCANQQLDAIEGLLVLVESIPRDSAALIVARCSGKWKDQWDMIQYCAEKQITAWRKLNQ